MQITFDTTTITDDEVRGIFALLDTVRPAAFDPGPFDAEEVTRAVEEKLADKGWVGEKITKLTETGEEVSREPIPTTDANGLPWDERIHSGTKALNADGTWRTKRGVDKALVASVEAELRGAQTPGSDPEELERVEEEVKELLAALPTASDVAESIREQGGEAEAISGEVHTSSPVPPAPPAPEAPLAPVAQTEAPTPPAATTSPFVALMKRVTTAQGAGKLTQPRVKELLESLDKKSIMDLRTDEDALASFAVLLDGEGV